MRYWVYDWETYPNICTVVFRLVGKEKVYEEFEISDRKNQYMELYNFLWECHKRKDFFIGYNNLFFDYPICHFVMTHPNADHQRIYAHVAHKILAKDENGRNKYIIWESHHKIRQIDLYKLKHFDRIMLSLKYLEFSLRWPKMPRFTI